MLNDMTHLPLQLVCMIDDLGFQLQMSHFESTGECLGWWAR